MDLLSQPSESTICSDSGKRLSRIDSAPSTPGSDAGSSDDEDDKQDGLEATSSGPSVVAVDLSASSIAQQHTIDALPAHAQHHQLKAQSELFAQQHDGLSVEKLRKRLLRRANVVAEILEGERSTVFNYGCFLKYYLAPSRYSAIDSDIALHRLPALSALFSLWPTLHAVHSAFVLALVTSATDHGRLAEASAASFVAPAFVDFAQQFRVFGDYAARFHEGISQLGEFSSTYPVRKRVYRGNLFLLRHSFCLLLRLIQHAWCTNNSSAPFGIWNSGLHD